MGIVVVFSGADGTGKSTIIKGYKDKLINDGFTVSVIWLRFISFFSKVVNLFGRFLGLNYVEKYTWGRIGYHDYAGWIAYVYVLAIYLDQKIFFYKFLFFHRFDKKRTNYFLYDRYLVDTIADLIVDTGKDRFILFLFSGMVRKLKSRCILFIFSCPYSTVLDRRPDIKDDKKYNLRVKAFHKLIRFFHIQRINTGVGSVEDIVAGLLV